MVSTPEDISKSPQLNARDWFVEIDDPGRGRRLRYPGPPVAAAWHARLELRRPAPLLGEHTAEVLTEIGVPPDEARAIAEGGER